MKNSIIAFFTIFFCFSSCNKKLSAIDPLPENSTLLKGTIELPSTIKTQTLEVLSVTQKGKIVKITKGARTNAETNIVSFSVPVGAGADSKNTIIWVFSEDKPLLASCINSSEKSVELKIITENIIKIHVNTLLNFHPFLAFNLPDSERERLSALIKNSSAFYDFTSIVESQFIGNPFPSYIDVVSNPRIASQIGVFWTEMDKILFSKPINVENDINGLKVDFSNGGLSKTDKSLKFSIENNRQRWLSVAIDGYRNGKIIKSFDVKDPGYSKSTISAPDKYGLLSLYTRLKDGERLKETKDFLIDASQFDKVSIKTYGLGMQNINSKLFSDEKFLERSKIPIAFTIADNFAIPIIELASSLEAPSLSSLVGRPNESPTIKFFVKIAESYVKDRYETSLDEATKEANLNGKISETEKKNIKELILDFGDKLLSTASDEPKLFKDMLVELCSKAFGDDILKTIAKQGSAYYKALEGGLLVYNLADAVYTVGTGSPYLEYNYKIENNELTYDVSSIIPDESLQALKDRGAIIYEGNTPPIVEGQYFMSPNTLKVRYDESDGYDVGFIFDNYMYLFGKQNGQILSISLDHLANGTIDENGTGSIITGKDNNFTIFAKTERTDEDGVFLEQVSVISGQVTKDGINNLEDAFIITNKKNDFVPKYIPVNTGRTVHDGDGFSEKVLGKYFRKEGTGAKKANMYLLKK